MHPLYVPYFFLNFRVRKPVVVVDISTSVFFFLYFSVEVHICTFIWFVFQRQKYAIVLLYFYILYTSASEVHICTFLLLFILYFNVVSAYLHFCIFLYFSIRSTFLFILERQKYTFALLYFLIFLILRSQKYTFVLLCFCVTYTSASEAEAVWFSFLRSLGVRGRHQKDKPSLSLTDHAHANSSAAFFKATAPRAADNVGISERERRGQERRRHDSQTRSSVCRQGLSVADDARTAAEQKVLSLLPAEAVRSVATTILYHEQPGPETATQRGQQQFVASLNQHQPGLLTTDRNHHPDHMKTRRKKTLVATSPWGFRTSSPWRHISRRCRLTASAKAYVMVYREISFTMRSGGPRVSATRQVSASFVEPVRPKYARTLWKLWRHAEVKFRREIKKMKRRR